MIREGKSNHMTPVHTKTLLILPFLLPYFYLKITGNCSQDKIKYKQTVLEINYIPGNFIFRVSSY